MRSANLVAKSAQRLGWAEQNIARFLAVKKLERCTIHDYVIAFNRLDNKTSA